MYVCSGSIGNKYLNILENKVVSDDFKSLIIS
jgi:hypothetical protein